MWAWVWATALAAEVSVTTISEAPAIDGVLDESVWQLGTPVTEMPRYQPTAGPVRDDDVDVRFLQDDTNLYIGVRVSRLDYAPRARMSPREAINADDQFGLYLDPYGDAQTGYIFYFNAIGIQQDIRFNAGDWNVAWNGVYRSRGTVTDTGYELEIALPFRSIQFPPGEHEQDWGVILTRKVPQEGAKYGFPQLVRGHPRMFEQAATLRGVRPPKTTSRVEWIPGAATRIQSTVTQDGASVDPAAWHERFAPFLDTRVRLSPNLQLITTLNPDFSQVESDITPVVLNARFAFVFPERRPFFTEGFGFLTDGFGFQRSDPQNTLYTRSIVQPLYGLKLAGREGDWSMGVLQTVDRAPQASVHERGAPGFMTEDVDGAWASTSVVRIRRDVLDAGWVGITLTDKRLFGSETEAANQGSNNVLGLDTALPLPKRWTAYGRQRFSTTGHADERIQGLASSVAMVRPEGQGLGLTTRLAWVGDGMREETGFLTQSGYLDALAEGTWTLPGKGILSTWTPGLGVQTFDEVNGDHYRIGSLRSAWLLAGVHNVGIEGWIDERREGDPVSGEAATVRGWGIEAAYEGLIGRILEVSPSVSAGRSMDFASLSSAQTASVRMDATLRTGPFRTDLIARHTWYEPRVGDDQQDTLVRARLQYQFTPTLGTRVITAFNRVTARADSVESSVLVTWLLHPFTAVHVGYAESRPLRAPELPLQRSVFAKAQVMFRS